MNRSRSLKSRPPGILLTTLGVVAALAGAGAQADGLADLFDGQLPNNFPFLNGAGTAATFSTAGFVDLTNQFHVPQGTNGRSCESCHLPQVGWSIRPVDVELKFLRARFCKRADLVIAIEELEVVGAESSGLSHHAAFGHGVFPALAGNVIVLAALGAFVSFAFAFVLSGGAAA